MSFSVMGHSCSQEGVISNQGKGERFVLGILTARAKHIRGQGPVLKESNYSPSLALSLPLLFLNAIIDKFIIHLLTQASPERSIV